MPTVTQQISLGAGTRPLGPGASPQHSGGWAASGSSWPPKENWRRLMTDAEKLAPQKIKHTQNPLWAPRSAFCFLCTRMAVSPLKQVTQKEAGWSRSGQGAELRRQTGDLTLSAL